MRKTAFVVLLTIILATTAGADFSGRNGYGRIGFRAAYPISLGQPFDWDALEEGDYHGVIAGCLEGGYGFNDYLELTIAVNFELADWKYQPEIGDEVGWDFGSGSAVLGLTGYFIEGDIRPYGRLDLGVSFHYSDDEQDQPGYTRSTAFGMGAGVGCQFVIGEVFYLEPYVHWRAHLSGSYEVEFDETGYEPREEDYASAPMSLHTGLGFGFLF
ncbi:MAG: hypothetical protein GF399_05125 [Candidatus Coatesbacteria bacterium]|nr:hypothetical protein [Candidatus Coatesbacteria bacterium]